MKYQNKKIIIFMIIFNTFLFFLTNCGDENKNVKLKLNLSNNLTALNQTCTITNEQNLSVRWNYENTNFLEVLEKSSTTLKFMLIKETTMTSVTVSGTNGRKKDTISIQINSFNPNQSNKVNDFEIINGEIVWFYNRPNDFDVLYIPRNINGQIVKSIAPNVFNNFTNIKRIIFAENCEIMQIANNNFNNLTALTKITFGNNLLKIKSNTFNNLSNLEDVFFPSSLISIGRYSFYNCNATWTNKNIVTDAVDGVTISYFKINKNMICQGIYYIDTTQEIDDLLLKYQSYGITNANDSINNLVFATNVIGVSDFAFANLPINNLYINQNMFYIGENAFYNSQINHIYNLNAINHIGAFGFAKNNFTTVNLPNIAELYDSAFAECSSLTSVTLSNNLIGLANNLFYNCNQLDSISFSYKLETIGDYCFYNTKLTSFRCPNSLYQIGEGAFFSNVELINFNYGNSIVNKIDFLTFGNCIKLTNLSTNKNINKIMANPFLGCTLLERENNFTNENNIVYFAHNNINYCLGGNALIPLKNEAANDYIEAYYAITTNLIATPNVTIRSNTNIIVPYAFYLLDDITSITFNQQLTSIAEYSFYRSCLTQLTIPSNVTQLGEYAFSGSEIVTLNLNAISTIPRHCFSNNKIASLNFVNGNREVLDWSFSNNPITTIKLINSLNNIRKTAFINSITNLTWQNITLSTNFYWATNVTSGKILVKNTTLVNATYSNIIANFSFGDIYINETTRVIWADAFLNSNITKVYIPTSVLEIDKNAFALCSKMTSSNGVIYSEYALNTWNKWALSTTNSYTNEIIITDNTYGISVRAFIFSSATKYKLNTSLGIINSQAITSTIINHTFNTVADLSSIYNSTAPNNSYVSYDNKVYWRNYATWYDMANLPVISSIDDENYILYGIIETTNQYLINTNSININSHEYYQLYHDQNKEIKYLTNSRYSLNQTTFDTQYIVGGGMFYTYYE